MKLRKALPIIGIISLLLLAGCSGINPLEPTDDRSKAEKINDSMHEVETAQTRVSTVRNISISSNNTSITNFQRQEVRTQYNFKNNSSVSNGVGEQYFAGEHAQYQFETFYKSGTVYNRRISTLSNSSEAPEWKSTQANASLREQFTIFSDESFFNNQTRNDNLSTNQTIVYQIDLLNGSNKSLIENHKISAMDKHKDYLDMYAVEIYVNNSTHRLEEVRVYAYGELSNKEVEQLQEVYQDREAPATGTIEYAMQIEFVKYNHTVDITVPEEAKEAQ